MVQIFGLIAILTIMLGWVVLFLLAGAFAVFRQWRAAGVLVSLGLMWIGVLLYSDYRAVRDFDRRVEQNFASIAPGMTDADVEARLGGPNWKHVGRAKDMTWGYHEFRGVVRIDPPFLDPTYPLFLYNRRLDPEDSYRVMFDHAGAVIETQGPKS